MGPFIGESSYGWVVVIGRFISGFLEVGTVKSFGVLLPDIVTQLGTSSGTIGLAFGLCHGLTFGLGPLTSALYRFTQSRLVMVIGSIVSAISISVASLSTDAIHLVSALVFTGLGYSLMCLPTIMALNKHFVDRFALAYGIAQTGPAVGMIVMPFITQRLADGFGWKGALLILGAINFHMMVTAIVTREPEHLRSDWQKKRGNSEKSSGHKNVPDRSSKDKNHIEAAKSLNGDDDTARIFKRDAIDYGSCVKTTEGKDKHIKKRSFLLRRFKAFDEETVGILSEDELSIQHAQNDYETINTNEGAFRNAKNDNDAEATLWEQKMLSISSRNNVCKNGCGFGTVIQYEDEISLHLEFGADISSDESDDTDNSPQIKRREVPPNGTSYTDPPATGCKGCLVAVVDFLDLSLMKDVPALALLQLSFVLLTTVHVGWMIFLVPHAVAKGIPLHRAVFLSTIGGVGNLIGRIAQGPMVDRKILTGVQLSVLLSFINAITFAVDPLLQTLSMLCVNAFFCGICSGALIPLVAICVRETVPPDRFANAIGLVSLSYGFGEPLGGYLAGRLSDVTHSFEKVFYAFSILEFTKALLLLAVIVMVRKKGTTRDS